MRGRILFVLVLGAYVAALLVRVDVLLRHEAADTLVRYAGESVLVEGKVVNDPERRDTSTHAYVSVSSVKGESARGTLLAILPREVALEYGDTVTVRGEIALPEEFETNAGRVFDYPSYLRVRGVFAMLRQGTVESVKTGGWSMQRFLYTTKHTFERSLERMFPEPENALLEGVLLGERRGVPQELTDAFITSGLIHVVVLSGYNISIVSEAALRAMSFLPPTIGYSLGAVFIVFFAIMTGAGATTVRACIMGLIAILARVLGRPSAALRALAVAALAMIMWNPLVALYDPSFILSVLATFGLITMSPRVERWLKWVPNFRYFDVRSIAASTIAVQIYVLPALLYITGVLSFFALPANVLALPVVPLAMLAGFFAGLLGFIHPVLGMPLMLCARALLDWMMFVANTAHALPYASTVVKAFPLWVAVAAYVPLTLLALRWYRNEPRQHPN